jgi:protoporphyrinogen oxidase
LFEDHVALPKKGIGSIAHAISQKLEPATICLRSKIKQVTPGGVEFVNGDFLPAKMVVIATNAIDLDVIAPQANLDKECSHVSTIYFESDKAPINKPVVVLNGDDTGGLVNHVFVPTTLQPDYAPAGKHLISVNVVKEHDLDDEELVAKCQLELSEWFGLLVNDWRHLKTYHIKYAMPFKPIVDEVCFTKKISDTVYYCGDSLSVGTMESALRSGRETAEAVGQVIDQVAMPAVSIAV